MELTGKSSKEVDEILRNAINNIRLGSIEIIIHDSKIVQIERKEKFRVDNSASRPHR